MTAPDLTGARLAFPPMAVFVAGDFDPSALLAALKAQPGLEDFLNDHGPQSAVRLDRDADPANVGFWVTVPDGTSQRTIDAAVKAYTPPPPPPAQLAPLPLRLDQALRAVPAGATADAIKAAVLSELERT